MTGARTHPNATGWIRAPVCLSCGIAGSVGGQDIDHENQGRIGWDALLFLAAVAQLGRNDQKDLRAYRLAGQTVGSQVLLVIPPELGYGSQKQQSIPANSTLIFVVDILAAY